MRISCIVCGSSETKPYIFPPYETCIECDHTYQPVEPPKVWMNPIEGNSNGFSGAVMNAQEKAANTYVANWIYERYKPNRTLDIGSGYPYLASRFAANGAKAHAVDGGFKEDLISVDGIHDVKTAAVDWEKDDLPWEGKFDLITMIHVFEHMYQPLEAATRAHKLLNKEGVFYIRLPNKDVPGIERDHTEGHATIHPSIYGTKSLLRIIEGAGFHLIWMEHQPGFGQTSFVFKKRPPKITLFMITKNEEHNIGPCLDSVRDFCDEMIVLDTGSTDMTVLKAVNHGAVVLHSKQFNKSTEVKDFHFSKARNEAMELASPDTDWLFWMDADDTFEGCPELNPELDGYNIAVVYGSSTLSHARFFRKGWSNGFIGAIHEVPEVSQCRMGWQDSCRVHHKVAVKEGRCDRNVLILESEFKADPNNLRTVFYLGNAYADAGRHPEAISKYRRYIKRGGNFHDELVIAHIHLANSYYSLGVYQESIKQAFLGLCVDDRWAELYCRIGESYMNLNMHNKAVHYFELALSLGGPPSTVLWTQGQFYDSLPKAQLSRCYEYLGNIERAMFYSTQKRKIEIQKAKIKKVIELVRPGALGDIIATTPSVEWFRRTYPDATIRYVCHASGIPVLHDNPDIDEISDAESETADERHYFQYPMDQGYPDKPMTKHLAEHFADSVGATLSSDWKCKLVVHESSLELPERYITFAVKTGWSKYKEWGLDRWEDLISGIKVDFPDIAWIQIGGPNEPSIEAADLNLNGKTNLREAFEVLKGSELFVGLDSVFNHASNALNVDAVIMFGSTHPTGSGYRNHTNLSSNLDCQPCYRENNDISVHPKPPCPYSHKCMVEHMPVSIVSDTVAAKLKNKSNANDVSRTA